MPSKLTEPQIAALKIAADGRLKWARPVLSGGGYFVLPGRERVREPTCDALVKRGLLTQPRGKLGDWSLVPVAITEDGRAALASLTTGDPLDKAPTHKQEETGA